MSRKTIELFHPFTAQSVGLEKESLFKIHSQSHILALKEIAFKNNWDVSISYLATGSRYECFVQDGITWKFWPLSFKGRQESQIYRKQWSLIALVAHLFRTPDLLIINFSGLGSSFARLLAKTSLLRRKKYMAMVGKKVKETDAQINFLTNASTVFVHSEKQQESLRSKFSDVYNLRFLPLGVDTKAFSEQNLISDERKFPRLLFVGRVVESKGILIALEAFEYVHNEFPDAVFNIIGPCSDFDLEKRIKTYITDMGLSKAVNLIGALPYEELPRWYQNSDLFIFPSSSESFGMVIIESMACGTPVIAIKGSGGPDELIVDDECGFLVSQASLKYVLQEILRNKEKLERMRHAASQRVKQNYSIEKTSLILEDVINSTLMGAA